MGVLFPFFQFFCFQAEDGIRDVAVTGVQTCGLPIDRKSTRLNSSHGYISYAVFCFDQKRTRLNYRRGHLSQAVSSLNDAGQWSLSVLFLLLFLNPLRSPLSTSLPPPQLLLHGTGIPITPTAGFLSYALFS